MQLFQIANRRFSVAVLACVFCGAVSIVHSSPKDAISSTSVNTIGLGFITNTVNRWLGNGDVVNPCSDAYGWDRCLGYGYNAAALGADV
jgi:hypothetical protein